MFKKRFIFIVAAFLSFVVTDNVLAKGEVSLKVAPLFFDLQINPGQEKTGKIYIENNSDEKILITPEFSDFFVNAEGGYIFSDNKKIKNENLKPYLMREWFSLDVDSFELKPGENRTVKYGVKVLKNANLGGHYGAIFFKTSCVQEKDEAVVYSDKSSLCVSGRVGTLFLIQVGGGQNKKGSIKDVDIPTLNLNDKIKLSIDIQNDGNTHFKPLGSISVKSITGREVYNLDIKDRTILPTNSRSFEGEFIEKSVLGIYRIKGDIKDGDGNDLYFQKWLFVFPWKKMIMIAVTLVILIWFFREYKIRIKKT